MATLTLGSVAAATGGTVISGDPDLAVRRYSIDSRSIKGGELFFALVGPNNDGHDYVDEVLRHGGAAVVVSRPETPLGPAVRVADTTRALRDLGRAVRTEWAGTVVGITGSCGKTTTKEMLRLVLEGSVPVHATPGNLNNLYGLPLVLLDLEPQHEVAVLEMGISTPGEMTPLADIARPDVALLLNVEGVHLANFPSVDAIAEAKLALIDALPEDGTVVYNAGDPRLAAGVARKAGARGGDLRTVGFALGASAPAADVRGEILADHRLRISVEGMGLTLQPPVGGRHNALNMLAATATGHALGVSLEAAARRLEQFRPAPMRGQRRRLTGGVTVWDESYNSNPAAMRAVLEEMGDEITDAPGRRVVISGDMLELGPAEEEEHRLLARAVAAAGTGLFVGVGPLSALTARELRDAHGIEALVCADAAEAAKSATEHIRDGDVVLVKGSRGMALDRVVQALVTARGEA